VHFGRVRAIGIPANPAKPETVTKLNERKNSAIPTLESTGFK